MHLLLKVILWIFMINREKMILNIYSIVIVCESISKEGYSGCLERLIYLDSSKKSYKEKWIHKIGNHQFTFTNLTWVKWKWNYSSWLRDQEI
jgi:hypothetical protein